MNTYFVGVHVALGTTAGLEDHEREVVDELSGDHLDDPLVC